MNDDFWEKAREIFITAIKLSPELRLPYLAEVCAGDVGLRREVESLLASHDDAGNFMSSPAVGEVADVIYPSESFGRGTSFSHYEIVEQIGAGGMGEIYLAEDTKLERRVAVKILNERFAKHESNLKRFIQEAKAASALNHPNILVIHEIGADENTNYIVSEFIKGKTLAEILKEKTLTLPEVLSIAIQIAEALRAAHEANLIHRDIKPENVMIRPDGIVKVLDFGLAKLAEQSANDFEKTSFEQNQTAEGLILGTVNYMSPEQARGEKISAATDVFSFGIVLFEMLTGQNPFRGETISHTVIAILESEPPPVSSFVENIPAEIERIVGKCLEKNLAARYASARDLLVDLKALEKRLEFETELERSVAPNKLTDDFTQSVTIETSSELIFTPNNLKENADSLVGREREISEIVNLLRQTEVRLVALTGIGGSGKTRLSQAVARELLTDFTDGVFFIELAAITNPDLVASAIAQPLGVREAGGKSILKVLEDYLADKKILLVIDNFEQVSDAATQIGALLDASNLKILITSRTLLHLSAEREYIVPPLAVDDAVELFTQRARRAKSGFVLTEETAESVAEICARLEGLPLAVELAAARVKILSPAAILAKLGNRLQLLTGGARDLPARQQTMRGAIEWSYELLGADEKKLFCRLAVFVGGFAFAAAETICGVVDSSVKQTDFLDLLTSLVDKSLLVTKESFDGEETRFQMLEVVREYALEQLQASGEEETTRRRHAGFFLAFAEEAEPHLQAMKGAEWLNRLEAEHDNLRAALEWSLENDTNESARLAGAIRNFWAIHCHFTEGRRWIAEALERGDSKTPFSVRFKLLNGFGSLTRMQGDYAAAREAYEQGLTYGKAADDLQQIAHSNRGLGLVFFQQGDLATARKFMEDGLTILRRLEDKFGLALTLTSFGDLERGQGNNAAARLLFEESIVICRQLGNKAALTTGLHNLGTISFEESDFAASRRYFSEVLTTALDLEEKIIISLSLDGFAALAGQQGDLPNAARIAGAAQNLREQIGYQIEPIDSLFREAYLTKLKTEMSEKDFAEFYEQGRKSKLEEAILLTKDSN